MINYLIDVIVKDCLLPAILALILWACHLKFWEAAMFYFLSESICNIWIERFDFWLYHTLARKITAPVIAPYVLLIVINFLAQHGGFTNSNFHNFSDALFYYYVFLFYRIIFAFAEPVIDLMIFGPTERTWRGELTGFLRAQAVKATGFLQKKEPV